MMKNQTASLLWEKIVFMLFLVLFAAGCASERKAESTGEYLDNSVITTKVKTAFFGDPKLKSLEIRVETFKGTVQLSGFVDTQVQKVHAEQVARQVEGVKSVVNNLIVK